MADTDDILTKDGLEEGMILWLRSDADKVNPEGFVRSGLDKGSLHHPVLLLMVLRMDHDLVWVCMMSSRIRPRNDRAGYVPLLEQLPVPREPCGECPSTHTFNNSTDAFEEDSVVLGPSMPMTKNTHIRVNKVFEVSLSMLCHWNRERSISVRSLDNMNSLTAGAIASLLRNSVAYQSWPETIDYLPCEVGMRFLEPVLSTSATLPMLLTGSSRRLQGLVCSAARPLLSVEPGDILSPSPPSPRETNYLFKPLFGSNVWLYVVLRVFVTPEIQVALVFRFGYDCCAEPAREQRLRTLIRDGNIPISVDNILVASGVESRPKVSHDMLLFIDTWRCLVVPISWLRPFPKLNGLELQKPRLLPMSLQHYEEFEVKSRIDENIVLDTPLFCDADSRQCNFMHHIERMQVFQRASTSAGKHVEELLGLVDLYDEVRDEILSSRLRTTSISEPPRKIPGGGPVSTAPCLSRDPVSSHEEHVTVPVQMYRDYDPWRISIARIRAVTKGLSDLMKQCQELGLDASDLTVRLKDTKEEARKLLHVKWRERP